MLQGFHDGINLIPHDGLPKMHVRHSRAKFLVNERVSSPKWKCPILCSCRKQAAVTDATKRALRLFGQQLGGNMMNKEASVKVNDQGGASRTCTIVTAEL